MQEELGNTGGMGDTGGAGGHKRSWETQEELGDPGGAGGHTGEEKRKVLLTTSHANF